jgi:hypothetical protein
MSWRRASKIVVLATCIFSASVGMSVIAAAAGQPGNAGAGGRPLAAVIPIALVLAFAGWIGGLLYGLRGHELLLPGRTPQGTYSLGFIADCLYGFSGAFVIFLIVPGDFDPGVPWTWIKILGLGLIGGYGGRGVIDRALSQAFKDLERKVDQSEIERQASADALRLAARQLTDDIPEVNERELEAAILSASPAMAIELLHRARAFRRQNAGNGELVGRTVPIYRALAARPDHQRFHRPFAQLAYALKDSAPPDLQGAIEQLTKAIELRDKSADRGFYKYELARAECYIERDQNWRDGRPTEEPAHLQILSDVNTARVRAGEKPFELNSAIISDWLRRNDPALLQAISA